MRGRAAFTILAVLASLSGGLVLAENTAAPPNTGSIDVRSTMIGSRVYLDDVYSGDADVFIEDVPAGEHSVAVRYAGQVLKGQFKLKQGEIMMLEARFNEDRIVDLKVVAKEEAAKRAETERKAEAERKAEEELASKKKESSARSRAEARKKTEHKQRLALAKPSARIAADEQQAQHLNIIRVDLHNSGVSDLNITHRIDPKITTNFSENKSTTGNFYRSKQDMLLCETGLCYRDWNGRFFYIDESGKRDAFLIRWKQTVFTGVTPEGTSREDMDICLNGDCLKIPFDAGNKGTVKRSFDRYVLSWSGNSFTIRRADILKKITEAGGKVPSF